MCNEWKKNFKKSKKNDTNNPSLYLSTRLFPKRKQKNRIRINYLYESPSSRRARATIWLFLQLRQKVIANRKCIMMFVVATRTSRGAVTLSSSRSRVVLFRFDFVRRFAFVFRDKWRSFDNKKVYCTWNINGWRGGTNWNKKTRSCYSIRSIQNVLLVRMPKFLENLVSDSFEEYFVASWFLKRIVGID